MSKPTSLAAYQDIMESRLLGDMQRRVVSALGREGSLTGRELNDALDSVSAHKRLSELKAMGVIRVRTVRKCRITGREVEAWELTGEMPSKPTDGPPQVSRPSTEQLRRCLPALRRMYLALTREKDPAAADMKHLGRWVAALTGFVEPGATPQNSQLPPPAPRMLFGKK